MTASARPIAHQEVEWIVCLGETRSAPLGHVACPRNAGMTVLVQECWECHLLAWRRDERDLAELCSTEPDNSR